MIRGFRGSLDFYYWRGVPVVRKWPVRLKYPYTPAQAASRAAFRQSRADLKGMSGEVRAMWPPDFIGRRQAWLDYYTGMYLRFWKHFGKYPPVVHSVAGRWL